VADLARTFDLLVVGGGINGASIARDAALRGLSVLLVERDDWCAGTTSKSSKLAHGGLRYLERFDFALVHEALQDRERLLRHAPHLVRPLRFLYPLYPHVVARRTVRIGLWLYDLLSHGKSLPNRKYLPRDKALQEAPGLAKEGLAGAATFYDAQIHHVERLVAETLWDAKRHGAVCLNRARVEYFDFERQGGRRRVTGAAVTLEDGSEVHVRARATVNATGCWADEVLGGLAEGKPPKVRLTKGAHIVVPRCSEVALMVRAKDGRSFFVLPWDEECIIGTTDTAYEGDPAAAVADAADVQYLIESARPYLPDAPLDEVRYTYAGVRALVNQSGVTESNVTRRHILYDHARRDGVDALWTLQGGKITTARTLAQECVDRVARFLGRKDLARRHPTRTTPYPGCPPQAWDSFRPAAVAQAAARVGIESAEHLVGTYGARWQAILEAGGEAGRQRIVPESPHLVCEVTHAVREEDARHVGDFMLRRSVLGVSADGTPKAARRVLEHMAALLAWSPQRRDEEWQRYLHEVQQFRVPGDLPESPKAAASA
jgi:glycerol-3-phosphate dehydrogenase